jgi:hypothetical protein
VNLSKQQKIDVARRGILFQELREHEAMKELLDTLQHRAEIAREELCGVDATRLKEKQDVVWRFRELMRIINGFIGEGLQVEQQLHEEDQLTE